MPYKINDDLPSSVKSHLPDHAQTIYRKAFNNAYEQYGTDAQAAQVAWSAVKKEYEKNNEGKWVKNNER